MYPMYITRLRAQSTSGGELTEYSGRVLFYPVNSIIFQAMKIRSGHRHLRDKDSWVGFALSYGLLFISFYEVVDVPCSVPCWHRSRLALVRAASVLSSGPSDTQEHSAKSVGSILGKVSLLRMWFAGAKTLFWC